MERISDETLRRIRNHIPIAVVIEDTLKIPSKHVEGIFRFLCPLCSEFNTATNPTTNLARCFRCSRNFNPIDIVMAARDASFLEAVRLLARLDHGKN